MGARTETQGAGREETAIGSRHTNTYTYTHMKAGPTAQNTDFPQRNAGSLCSCFVQRQLALLHVAIYWQQYNSLTRSCFIK